MRVLWVAAYRNGRRVLGIERFNLKREIWRRASVAFCTLRDRKLQLCFICGADVFNNSRGVGRYGFRGVDLNGCSFTFRSNNLAKNNFCRARSHLKYRLPSSHHHLWKEPGHLCHPNSAARDSRNVYFKAIPAFMRSTSPGSPFSPFGNENQGGRCRLPARPFRQRLPHQVLLTLLSRSCSRLRSSLFQRRRPSFLPTRRSR